MLAPLAAKLAKVRRLRDHAGAMLILQDHHHDVVRSRHCRPFPSWGRGAALPAAASPGRAALPCWSLLALPTQLLEGGRWRVLAPRSMTDLPRHSPPMHTATFRRQPKRWWQKPAHGTPIDRKLWQSTIQLRACLPGQHAGPQSTILITRGGRVAVYWMINGRCVIFERTEVFTVATCS